MFSFQYRILQNHLKHNWLLSDVVLDDNDFVPEPGIPWVSFTASWADSRPISVSKGSYKDDGIAIVSVFTPLNAGEGRNIAICQEVINLFKGWSFGRLICKEPYIKRVGEEEEWFHQNVMIPFSYDGAL